MLKRPPTHILTIKDVVFFSSLAPLIICITLVGKIKWLKCEKTDRSGIVVSLSYCILFMIAGIGISFNLIPLYVYMFLSGAIPFAAAFTNLKRIDFTPLKHCLTITKAFLKKKLQKKTVVKLKLSET